MFRFLRSLGGPKPNFDSIQFDTEGWQTVPTMDSSEGPLWKTPEGDAAGLHLIRRRTRLPQSMDLYGYRNLFVRSMQSSLALPVELGVMQAASMPCLRFLYKIPQPKGDWAQHGTLTFPFQKFCFIYEVHCMDHGSGALREERLKRRGVELPERGPREWPPEPRTPQPDMANFDAEFPDSPVARLRRCLDHIATSACIEPEIAALASCSLPN